MAEKKWITLMFCLTLSSPLWAQSATERTDWMRSNGLLFVVLGVLIILFTGLFIYLVLIDRKLKKIEKTINNNENE